jgi:hypothetical protein
MRRFSTIAVVMALAVVLGACTGDEGTEGAGASGTSTGSSPVAPITPVESPSLTASPTPPALPSEPPLTRGVESSTCVNGWVTPPEGSPRALQPVGIIRKATGVEGPLEIVDLRYFQGPESPPSDKGYLLLVQRWYVKLYAKDDLAFQGRFLVEARRFGRGLVAVAPYDTFGFRSPDWIGFQYDSGDAEAVAYPRLPGTWSGIPYDFVEGGEGLTIPGLPEEVAGCLDAT